VVHGRMHAVPLATWAGWYKSVVRKLQFELKSGYEVMIRCNVQ
jgi:hypothetical protein